MNVSTQDNKDKSPIDTDCSIMGREEKMSSTGTIPAVSCWVCYAICIAVVACVFAGWGYSKTPWRMVIISCKRRYCFNLDYQGLEAIIETTLVIYAFSLYYSNTSMYDPAWTFLPLFIAVGWIVTSDTPLTLSPRGLYTFVLLFLWCVRYVVMHPWDGWTKGVHAEDWRYIEYYKAVGGGIVYWIGSLVSLHLTPSLLVFFGLGPVQKVWSAGKGGTPLSYLDLVAIVVTVSALCIQTMADYQLTTFRGVYSSQTASDPTKCCRSGLWSWSRHPNYFGEALFWLGIALIGFAENQQEGFGWSWGGSIAMFLFFRLSCHLTDQRNLKRKPGYSTVMNEVSAFVLCPPKSTVSQKLD